VANRFWTFANQKSVPVVVPDYETGTQHGVGIMADLQDRIRTVIDRTCILTRPCGRALPSHSRVAYSHYAEVKSQEPDCWAGGPRRFDRRPESKAGACLGAIKKCPPVLA
jgi:hypothetical protein